MNCEGQAPAKWKNQSLAWFLNRLQLAQAEGQGIPTILRSMREEGCPPPKFEVNEVRVVCLLPAHPRHTLAREHRRIEEAISLGDFERARKALTVLVAQDSMNVRTLQLFAEVQRALNAPEPVKDLLGKLDAQLQGLPPMLLTQFADVLTLAGTPSRDDLALARRLYLDASKGRYAEQEIRQVAVGLSRAGDDKAALTFLNAQFDQHPDLKDNPWILRIRGNALIGLAKQCSLTGKKRDLPPQTKRRTWEDCRRFLQSAEQDLRRAASLTADGALTEGIQTNLDFVNHLKQIATPPERRGRREGKRQK